MILYVALESVGEAFRDLHHTAKEVEQDHWLAFASPGWHHAYGDKRSLEHLAGAAEEWLGFLIRSGDGDSFRAPLGLLREQFRKSVWTFPGFDSSRSLIEYTQPSKEAPEGAENLLAVRCNLLSLLEMRQFDLELEELAPRLEQQIENIEKNLDLALAAYASLQTSPELCGTKE